jgi:prophage antirepressor-like protein
MNFLKNIDESIDIIKIRSIEKDGERWYIAKDICSFLDMTNITIALKKIPENWIKVIVRGLCAMKIINDAAIYKLLLRCTKPGVKLLQDKILSEILPVIIGQPQNVDKTFDISKIKSITKDGKTWYITSDVCKFLDLKNTTSALKKIPDEWKDTMASGVRIINISAFYKLLMCSTKLSKQVYQDKICSEILPNYVKNQEGTNDDNQIVIEEEEVENDEEEEDVENKEEVTNEEEETKEEVTNEEEEYEYIIEEEEETNEEVTNEEVMNEEEDVENEEEETTEDATNDDEEEYECIIEEEDSETFNIVKFIEDNPISRLSNSYQNKLVNKIKRTFSTEEKQIFLASFYCYLNFKSDEFVVDLDDIWEWMGFSRKDHAKRLLEKEFIIEVEYMVKIVPPPKGENLKGGRPGEQILMTVKTFKKMCLLAGTKKSREIHEYYINLEEIIHETVDEETSELRRQLENKDREIEEHKVLLHQQEIDKIIEMAKMLADNFDLKHIMYLGYIGIINGKHTYKFGYTDNIKERMKVHINDYGKFELIYCIECRENRKLEKKFKKNKKVEAKQFSHVFTVKNKRNDGTKKMKKVELFCLDDFTLEDAKKILQRYKKFLDAKYDEKLETIIENNENGIDLVDEGSPIVIAPAEPVHEDENMRKLINQCLPEFLSDFMYQHKNRGAPQGMRWCNSFCQKFVLRCEFTCHLKFLLTRCKSCVRCERSALDKINRGILTPQQISNNPTLVMIPDNTKECITCHKIKPFDHFPEKRNSCKKCRNKVRSKYKNFDEVVEEHIKRLSNMKTREEIDELLETYVNDNFKVLCAKLKLGRKFNDSKQMLKLKVADYFISKNWIL